MTSTLRQGNKQKHLSPQHRQGSQKFTCQYQNNEDASKREMKGKGSPKNLYEKDIISKLSNKQPASVHILLALSNMIIVTGQRKQERCECESGSW